MQIQGHIAAGEDFLLSLLIFNKQPAVRQDFFCLHTSDPGPVCHPHTSARHDIPGNIRFRDSLLLRLFNQCIQQVEAIHFWFQFIVEHGLERGHLRVHNDNACRNTRFAEFGTFISHSHSQKIDMMFLQCLGNLIRTGSIADAFTIHTIFVSGRSRLR